MRFDKSILCVDDDEDDVAFLSEALQQIDPHIKIAVAENGLKALDYLDEIREKDNKLPCLIILDINMPYMDGKQTFYKLQADPVLQKVPVVIFTSSAHPADKAMFTGMGIEFITKPNTLSGIQKIADQLLRNC